MSNIHFREPMNEICEIIDATNDRHEEHFYGIVTVFKKYKIDKVLNNTYDSIAKFFSKNYVRQPPNELEYLSMITLNRKTAEYMAECYNKGDFNKIPAPFNFGIGESWKVVKLNEYKPNNMTWSKSIHVVWYDNKNHTIQFDPDENHKIKISLNQHYSEGICNA